VCVISVCSLFNRPSGLQIGFKCERDEKKSFHAQFERRSDQVILSPPRSYYLLYFPFLSSPPLSSLLLSSSLLCYTSLHCTALHCSSIIYELLQSTRQLIQHPFLSDLGLSPQHILIPIPSFLFLPSLPPSLLSTLPYPSLPLRCLPSQRPFSPTRRALTTSPS
jgi:hypothetical protein